MMCQVLKLQQKIENLTFSYTETDGVEHQYNLTKGKSQGTCPCPGIEMFSSQFVTNRSVRRSTSATFRTCWRTGRTMKNC